MVLEINLFCTCSNSRRKSPIMRANFIVVEAEVMLSSGVAPHIQTTLLPSAVKPGRGGMCLHPEFALKHFICLYS